ncbi:lysine-rich coiled-coil protein 1 [Rhynchocyon petersi]
MKNSKKTYDSFQDELEDYIKVQKARGLEPKTCFRRMREDYLKTFGYKEMGSRPRYRMSDQRLPFETVQTYSWSSSIPQTLEYELPQQLPAHDNRMRLGSASYCQLTRNYSSGKPVPLNLGHQEYHYGSYSRDSLMYKHLSSKNSPTAHQASQREIHENKKRHHAKHREQPEEEQSMHKKKKSCEEMDRYQSTQRKQAEMEAVNIAPEKLKHRKEKKSKVSKKEERKHRKEKKNQGQERTEEEMLWDQSILGF